MVDEKEKMIQLEAKVEHQTRQIEQLIYAITGSSTMGTKGLLQRLEILEKAKDDQARDTLEAQQFMFNTLDSIEANLDRKFDTLNKHIDSKFTTVESFKKDVQEFKMLISVLTSAKAWKFVFRIIGLFILIGGIVATWYNGGYEYIVKSLKMLLK